MPRSYSKEFKESIVDLIHQGHTVRSLAKEYDIVANTITRWIRQDNFLNHNSSTVPKEEYLKIKKELERKDEEIKILKLTASGVAWQISPRTPNSYFRSN